MAISFIDHGAQANFTAALLAAKLCIGAEEMGHVVEVELTCQLLKSLLP